MTNNEWLYQVRITLSQSFADDLRSVSNLDLSKEINKIAGKHKTRAVCTLDGFLDYVKEAEKNGIKEYPLYHWTKSVVDDPQKKLNTHNHLRSTSGMSKFMKSNVLSLYIMIC